MKIVYSSELEELSILLNHKNMGVYTLNGKIEAFDISDQISNNNPIRTVSDTTNNYSAESSSLLNVNIGRKRSNSDLSCLSNIRKPIRRGRSSSLGDLGEPSSHKIIVNLIATMNEIFPDYDFEIIKPNQFIYQDLSAVMRNVNTYLAEFNDLGNQLLTKLWQSLDYVIELSRCDILSYVPKYDDDSLFSDGCLWSFNYFFFNKESYRICYFSCVAESNLRIANINDTTFDDDDENCVSDYEGKGDISDEESDNSLEVSSSEDENIPAWDGII